MIDTILERRYQIIQTIAQGGFGETYLAQDLKRPGNPLCVVKQLKLQNTNPNVLNKTRELFGREAEILEKLGKHPQIPQLLAYEEAEFYLVQEYIAGHTLAEKFDQQQRFSELQVINLISELLKILDFVHSNKVIHRDIKPQNIIISEPEQKLVLIDFGAVKQIANTAHSGTLIGTPGYAAPEQMHGKPSYCSDLYGVGMIGIQALTGTHPNFMNEVDKIHWDETEVSPKLVDFLTKLVQHDFQQRYQSAQEAIAELRKITRPPATTINIDSKEVQNNNTTLIESHNKIGNRKAFYLLISLFCLILFGLGFWGIKKWQNNRLNDFRLNNNQTVQGRLDSENICDNLISNVYCEQYTFTGKKGQQVEIELKSQDFDPYLILRTPDGNKLQVSEDLSPNNWNAKIIANLPMDGEYEVIVRTSAEGESGNYNLRALIK